jgi:hypothetical protein
MFKKSIFLFLLLICFGSIKSQITNFKEKFTLPNNVNETSGLLFFNGKIITHNDSGGEPNLYEIDSLTGSLLRTIAINNASNIDWEAITEDETHIYIGDIGNNSGNRQDLCIYKILKTDYEKNTTVDAEKISFSYEDQTDFTSKPNNTNFDAEAIIFHENALLIFSKNWINFQTNVYKIPTSIGSYSATKVSSANIGGLITDATIHNNNIMLCGYDTSAIPFLIYISNERNSGDAVFNANFEKYSLINELEQGSQIEGITSFGNGRYYISREAVNNSFVTLDQKLFEFSDARTQSLSIQKIGESKFTCYPNPVVDKITLNSDQKIILISFFDILGKVVLDKKNPDKTIDISLLSKGTYFLKIKFYNNKSIFKKVIKH